MFLEGGRLGLELTTLCSRGRDSGHFGNKHYAEWACLARLTGSSTHPAFWNLTQYSIRLSEGLSNAPIVRSVLDRLARRFSEHHLAYFFVSVTVPKYMSRSGVEMRKSAP